MEDSAVYKDFESCVNSALGELIRADEEIACAMWLALANREWLKSEGPRVMVGYSFREAGSLIAEIRNDGSTYMDWYCCNYKQGRLEVQEFGYVLPLIAEKLAPYGWKPIYDLGELKQSKP